MSIGITIETIAGSLRQAAVSTGATGSDAGAARAASSRTQSPEAASSEPASARLSPGFSVVVLQVLNEQGAVVATVPSAQQLAAYRNGTATPPAA